MYVSMCCSVCVCLSQMALINMRCSANSFNSYLLKPVIICFGVLSDCVYVTCNCMHFIVFSYSEYIMQHVLPQVPSLLRADS